MLTMYKVMLGFSVVLLLFLLYRVERVRKMPDSERELRMLRFLLFGINLTAMSYLFHIVDYSKPGHISPSGTMFCIAGTFMLVAGWSEYSRLLAAKLKKPRLDEDEQKTVEAFSARTEPEQYGDPTRISARARHVLSFAQEEARRLGDSRVDTEHLLLGLLREPCGVGVQILHRIHVDDQDIQGSLARQMVGKLSPGSARDEPPRQARPYRKRRRQPIAAVKLERPLSERAAAVIHLAEQEARRFDSPYVGTEHLLLGLVLRGDGLAAHALMRCGVTVDLIRQELATTRTAVH
jgi:ATP-dependent Clp protease ATP-binding subunit ClpA